MFGSCVDSHKKDVNLGPSHKNLFEPPILTLETQYFHNICTYNIGR